MRMSVSGNFGAVLTALRGKRVGVIVSGGNVDLERSAALLRDAA